MGVDGSFANAFFRGHFLHRFPFRDQAQYFHFAPGDRLDVAMTGHDLFVRVELAGTEEVMAAERFQRRQQFLGGFGFEQAGRAWQR